MITEDGEFIKCEDCDEKIKNHAWAKIKADGWFLTRDGRAYCPNHQSWVAGWRKRKKS